MNRIVRTGETMSTEKTRTFTKLRGRENFDTWKVAAKSYLVINGLWSYTQKLPNPEKTTDMENDLKAWSEINLLLDESIYSYMSNTTTAKDAWTALENAFQDSGVCRRVCLLKQLMEINLEDCASTENYVNEVMSTSQKVKNSGLKLDDEVIASLLLAGLPSNMDPFVMAIENSGKKLTVDGVKTLLLQESRLGKGTNGQLALAAKFGKSKSHKKQFKCYNCGKTGHFAKDCTADKGENRASAAF